MMADDTNAQGRRYPQNLEGVLRFAVENSSSNPDNHAVEEMSEERRQFLQEALSQFAGPNPVDRMKVIIDHLTQFLSDPKSHEDDDAEDHMSALLDELVEWCEQIDFACDFHKINGFKLFPLLQNCGIEELRCQCGDLIAAVCQNNPYCQEKIITDTNQLETLMRCAKDLSEPVSVRIKAVYAISNIVKSSDQAQEKFVQLSGYEFLIHMMQDSASKISTKATFLLMCMMRDNAKHKTELTKMGCVEQLLTLLSQEHNQNHEHVMAALLELLTDHPAAVSELQRQELGALDFLQKRIESLQNKPEHEEELESAHQIESILLQQQVKQCTTER